MGGTMDKLKGKLKKAEGELTNDKVREAQGWVEEKKGEVERKVERATERIKEKFDEKFDKTDDTDVEADVNVKRNP